MTAEAFMNPKLKLQDGRILSAIAVAGDWTEVDQVLVEFIPRARDQRFLDVLQFVRLS
jgi:hypothetical protein